MSDNGNHEMQTTKTGPLPGRHLPGTDGAQDVRSRDFDLARLAIADLVRLKGIGGLFGDVGLGKTFAAIAACEMLAIPSTYWEPEPHIQHKDVEIGLLEALTGEEPDERRTRRDLSGQIKDLLECRRLLVIDEFERLGFRGVEQIRYYAARPKNQTAFLLVGAKLDPFIEKNPALQSRIARRIEFTGIPSESLVANLSAYHPFFSRSEPEKIWLVERRYAHGNWRRWARVLEIGLTLSAGVAEPCLTDELIEAIFAEIKKTAEPWDVIG